MAEVIARFSAVPLGGSAELGALTASGALTVRNPSPPEQASMWRRINLKESIDSVAKLAAIGRVALELWSRFGGASIFK